MTTLKMTNIARPYALAAFEFALDKEALSSWQAMLDAAAVLTQDFSVQKMLMSPDITTEQLINLYCDILAQWLSAPMTNFIRLLASNDRLEAIPDIAELFKSYCALQEKKLNVQITSAVPLNDKYQQQLIHILNERLHRQVTLECEIDPALIGGAIIVAGDTVIDGSVRGKLDRMMKFISESL
ncbi:MAG TPA: F0F1 ATP synthase subunit delta [Gammaproteobacteria bacterium]|nr:F0F1 ATP synthase subunit delta [Gammaproteobacteria bacterium]